MEFPRHPDPFASKQPNSPVPLTLESLNDAFRKAREGYQDTSRQARTFLQSALADKLAQLGLGWGNRLERQMDSFVPVVISAGGSLGEATDHLLATKLLRKLKGRFDLGVGQLAEFHDVLTKEWDGFDRQNLPIMSTNFLNIRSSDSAEHCLDLT